MRVFLSSTYEDPVDYRMKAPSAIERLGQQGIRMEVFGARPFQATAACLSEIDECDAMVGLCASLWFHSGWLQYLNPRAGIRSRHP